MILIGEIAFSFALMFKISHSQLWIITVNFVLFIPCRKMQNPGAIDLASKSHSGSEFPHVKPKEEVDSYKPDMKVHCLCGKSSDSESMVQVVLLL